MRRRDFIKGIVSSATAWPLAARAQEPGRTYRLGNLVSSPRNAPYHVALLDELRRAGFIEGKNLTVDNDGYGLRPEQFAEHAAELVNRPLDVIQAGGDAAVRAAQRATSTIPIIAMTDDMIEKGFVRSLAKPGGNITGVSIFASELDDKREEVLIEFLPSIHRVAALVDTNTTTQRGLDKLQEVALVRGVALSIHRVTQAAEIGPVVNGAKASNADALNVLASSLLFNNRRIIFEHVDTLRLPAMYQWPEMAEEGGFLAYGPRIVQLYRDVMARQLIQLLRGMSPADLPVEQPTRFELVVNLKTAKRLGLTIPESFLQRADKVIE
jgi:putative ABC transport system substrate-binding protein